MSHKTEEKRSRVVGVNELANELGRSRTWIYRCIDNGQLPKPRKLVGCTVWRREVIERWLSQVLGAPNKED